MPQDARIKFLNDVAVPSAPAVVYWMQASVRAAYNHALEYALHVANHRSQPLHVIFCLTPTYPDANLRHYRFLLEGLADVANSLNTRGVGFTVWLGDPLNVVDGIGGNASTVVVDRGYLRHQRAWRRELARRAQCPVVQVESNVVVPVETVSTKEEYSAATIRRKIHSQWEEFLVPIQTVTPHAGNPGELLPVSGSDFTVVPREELSRPEVIEKRLTVDDTVAPSPEFHGGETQAHTRLEDFLTHRLADYSTNRNDPEKDWLSGMSPYLHFGHISPVEIALRAVDYAESALAESEREGVDTLLEELIVRRELAMNYTEYNDHYDSYAALPEWARTTLAEHESDPRPHEYTREQLERGTTDDPYWNACQLQMVKTGKMHGYMRMYWGKKILEWTVDPAEAFGRAVYLNDKYELDGRDPNGYAGVAWVFGKHDRPWAERSIFGKVRYMNANGLRRKFKEIDRYVDRWTSS